MSAPSLFRARPILHRSVSLLTGAILFSVALLGFGGSPPPDDVEDRLRVRIEAARSGSAEAMAVGPEHVQALQSVGRFYRSVEFEPAWIGPAGPTPQAETLLTIVRNASRHGLRPADYHVSTIDSLRRRLRSSISAGQPMDARNLADFELLCTDAFLMYGAHLLGGRVDPVEVVPTWNLERRQRNLVQQLRDALDTGSIRDALGQLAPPQAEYKALQQALRRYRAVKRDGGWPDVPTGPKLEQGMTDPRVAILRHRLDAIGGVPDTLAADSAEFGVQLHEAVSRFQERHGLSVDGVVGPATLEALNVPVSERIQQIRVNLERWRWLPQDLGDPHVIVNIAAFWLRVVEDGEPTLQMRVVTGLPFRQTPVFSDQITYLVFNPYWHVPHSIATEDKLPDFKRNPSLVSTLGYEVFEGWGGDARKVDPSAVTWDRLSASTFPYRLRQKPGSQNALGRVKFMFPNPYSVYLHDTPTRGHFDQAERTFSSGCIRVEKPADLAAFLLRENNGWTTDRVQEIMAEGRERTVVLQRKVPVHLLYWTAWADEAGTIHFRNDVYDRDGAVAAALNAPTSPPSNLSTQPESEGMSDS